MTATVGFGGGVKTVGVGRISAAGEFITVGFVVGGASMLGGVSTFSCVGVGCVKVMGPSPTPVGTISKYMITKSATTIKIQLHIDATIVNNAVSRGFFFGVGLVIFFYFSCLEFLLGSQLWLFGRPYNSF